MRTQQSIRRRAAYVATLAALGVSSVALADSVTLKNGDTINGKIGEIGGGTLKFSSDALGDLSIKLENVTSFAFDEPTKVRPKGAATVTGKVEGDTAAVKVDERSYPIGEIKIVNPPEQKWNGAVIGNFMLARGNTNRMTIGMDANAALRRDDDHNNDRFSLGGSYNYGDTGGGAGNVEKSTDTDNWFGQGKYDKFWTDKFYTYALMRVEHDRIANLYYRLSPGVGLGYQWWETPKINFATEAGLTYVYERYDEGDPKSNDHIALRLAYHYDNKWTDWLSFFHNLEWVPAFEDPSDYTLTADAGLRAKITGSMFGQAKVVYKRDSEPAENALKNDLEWYLGVGWTF